MTHADPSAELAELQTQKKTAHDSYKEQKRVLQTQIKSLRQDAKRSRKISKLESRLGELKRATVTEE